MTRSVRLAVGRSVGRSVGRPVCQNFPKGREVTFLRSYLSTFFNIGFPFFRRKEVLEQFFNKKEAELQKQLGLQSAKYIIEICIIYILSF